MHNVVALYTGYRAYNTGYKGTEGGSCTWEMGYRAGTAVWQRHGSRKGRRSRNLSGMWPPIPPGRHLRYLVG